MDLRVRDWNFIGLDLGMRGWGFIVLDLGVSDEGVIVMAPGMAHHHEFGRVDRDASRSGVRVLLCWIVKLVGRISLCWI